MAEPHPSLEGRHLPLFSCHFLMLHGMEREAHGAQSNPPQVQWGASPRGSWDPVQSLTPGQEYSMLGKCFLEWDKPCSYSLGGRGVPTLFLGREREQSCGRTSQQDARRLGSAAISLLREKGDGPTQRLRPGQAEGNLGAN